MKTGRWSDEPAWDCCVDLPQLTGIYFILFTPLKLFSMKAGHPPKCRIFVAADLAQQSEGMKENVSYRKLNKNLFRTQEAPDRVPSV